MQRFYEAARVTAVDNGYAIELDGRAIKTPEKRPSESPTRALADAICEEWNGQGNKVDANSMPLAKLQYTAIDRVMYRREDLIDELIKYTETDLLCYRSDFPQDLIDLQAACWQPLLDWVKTTHDVSLKVTSGILHVKQDAAELAKIRPFLEAMDSFELTAFYNITILCGSVSIALNLFGGTVTADQGWDAAQLDENFQITQWGTDSEAEIRHNNMKAELDNTILFLTLLRA